jgi:rhodanese-related sulfurtransferase
VEKRIDVLATAIRGGFGVSDLIDLDLAYAPPYGSAKDPVNMAGMAGENVLNGTLKLWYGDDLDAVMADQLVLDVRSQSEYASGHVPGCLLVPHTQVRDRLDEIRTAAAGRPVAVMCAAGVRSYLAHRILDQEGFDSSMLSGGMRTLMATLGDRAVKVLN